MHQASKFKFDFNGKVCRFNLDFLQFKLNAFVTQHAVDDIKISL